MPATQRFFAHGLHLAGFALQPKKEGASQLIDAKGSNANAQDGSVVAPEGSLTQPCLNVKEKFQNFLDSFARLCYRMGGRTRYSVSPARLGKQPV